MQIRSDRRIRNALDQFWPNATVFCLIQIFCLTFRDMLFGVRISPIEELYVFTLSGLMGFQCWNPRKATR